MKINIIIKILMSSFHIRLSQTKKIIKKEVVKRKEM